VAVSRLVLVAQLSTERVWQSLDVVGRGRSKRITLHQRDSRICEMTAFGPCSVEKLAFAIMIEV
jgi:hypothetical protein